MKKLIVLIAVTLMTTLGFAQESPTCPKGNPDKCEMKGMGKGKMQGPRNGKGNQWGKKGGKKDMKDCPNK